MTWNFDYTIPSVIVLLFFLIFYFIKPVLLAQSFSRYIFFILRYFLISMFFAYLLKVKIKNDIPTIITFIIALVIINPWIKLINNTKDFPDIREAILNRFKQPWKVYNSELQLNVFVVDIDDNIVFGSIEDISSGYGIAYAEGERGSINHITIDKKSFNEIVRKTKVTKALNRALLYDDLQNY